MKKKGFLLINILMGLFILSIVSVTCLPILNTALSYLSLTKDKMDMLFIAESTIEQIKSFNYNCTKEDEYLFDIRLIELIDILNDEDLVTIILPLDVEDNNFKYSCTIHKKNKSMDLWEIWAQISPLNEGRKISDIKVETIMPIPKNDKDRKE